MGQGGDIDNPEKVGFVDAIPKQMSEVEMSQVVDSELHLKPISGLASAWDRHDCCIIHQVVHLLKRNRLGKLLYWIFATQVEADVFDVVVSRFCFNPFDALFRFELVSCAYDDVAAQFGHLPQRALSNARVASSNHHIFGGEVSLRNHKNSSIDILLQENEAHKKSQHPNHKISCEAIWNHWKVINNAVELINKSL